jgi:uncharacterized protein
MLTRDGFVSRFSKRAVFGMVHMAPLPGSPLFGGSIDAVIDAAAADAIALESGGVDAILFENFGDRPFFATKVDAVTIAAMTRVIADVVRELERPFGVNVLRNDPASALAIAAATGAAAIRVNVHTGAMLTDQGIIEGEAATTLRLRASLAPDVLIFADHLVKHATPLVESDPVQTAKDLRLRGLADAIIVTGVETGAAPDARRFESLRAAIADAPLIAGSGVGAENASTFAFADAAIVGTAFKRNGDVSLPVERDRVERIVRAFKD